jgi:multidrug efflux pump subunit AcrA (membrane-fusion protein)
MVDSQRRVNLFFHTDGRLQGFLVEPGDKVEEGELLAELDLGFLPFELEKAQACLDMAELKLDMVLVSHESAVAEASRRVERAERLLAQALDANSDSELSRARSSWEVADAALRQARREYYVIAGNPNAEESPQATAFQEAKQQYDIARADYDRMKELIILESDDYSALLQDIELARNDLRLLVEEQEYGVALLKKEIELAEIDVELLSAQISGTQLRAPFDAVVRYTTGEAGQLIAEYEPVLGLADTDALELRSREADAADNAKLRLGQQALIVFRPYPNQEVEGRVIQVSVPPQADQGDGQNLPIRIEFPVQDLDLEVGMVADIRIIVERKEDVLLIPSSTILSYFNRRYVLVDEGGRKMEVDVELGVSDGEYSEVLSGLEEGDLVLER